MSFKKPEELFSKTTKRNEKTKIVHGTTLVPIFCYLPCGFVYI